MAAKRRPGRPKKRVDGAAVAELRTSIASLNERIRTAEADPESSDAHLAALYNAKTSAVAKLAKLTGEDEVTMQMIVRSSAWRQCMTDLENALVKHPEAAAAVVKVFEALEAT